MSNISAQNKNQGSVLGPISIVVATCSVVCTAAMALGADRSAVARHENQIPKLIECSKRLEIQVEVLREMLPRIERKVDSIDAKLERGAR